MSKTTKIKDHEGKKYLRKICEPAPSNDTCLVDVYAVLEAFEVRCPACQHAIKKLLCAGLRDKGKVLDDLVGALAAVNRAVEMERCRQRDSETIEDHTLQDGELPNTPTNWALGLTLGIEQKEDMETEND